MDGQERHIENLIRFTTDDAPTGGGPTKRIRSHFLLGLLCLCILSHRYERTARRELGCEYPSRAEDDGESSPLSIWYDNHDDVPKFEAHMRRKLHYVIRPEHLWTRIAHKARTRDETLADTLAQCLESIEYLPWLSISIAINTENKALGSTKKARHATLCRAIVQIDETATALGSDSTTLSSIFEHLFRALDANATKFQERSCTPKAISTILSTIVTLDPRKPSNGRRARLGPVLDFACGSGGLLLDIRRQMGERNIGKLFGQDIDATQCGRARMNMHAHGLKPNEFEIRKGDSLLGHQYTPDGKQSAREPRFDAIVSHAPFNIRWDRSETERMDKRFRRHGLAPVSSADFAFLLHGLYYLEEDGVMGLVTSQYALWRKGTEATIRRKLVEDGHIDTVIALPPKLLQVTATPTAILVVRRTKRRDDVLFIDATREYRTIGQWENRLSDEHVEKIVDTYRERSAIEEYARCVAIETVGAENADLSPARYVDTPSHDASHHGRSTRKEHPTMKTKTAVLIATMACAPHVGGETLETRLTGPFAPTPGTRQAERLMANEATIVRLADQARTAGRTTERLAAFATLRIGYTEASLNLAIELIDDPDTAVAAESAQLLANTLTMSGSVTMGQQAHAPGTPARRRFDAAVDALRNAVDHAHVEVREVAARTLAYLEDRTAFDAIELGVGEGVIPAIEAIGYFGLASSELGGPYVEKYLNTGPVETRAAAAGYLATVPVYQPRIRDLILKEQVDKTLLAKVAGVLSRHDRTFPTYAAEIASRLNISEAN